MFVLVGSGVAFALVAPSENSARAILTDTIASVAEAFAAAPSQGDFDARLAALDLSINQRISSVASSASSQNAATYHVVSQSQRIDFLAIYMRSYWARSAAS